MRILFTRFPLESRMGGAEVQVLSLMKGLASHDHDIRFLGSCPILLEHSEELRVKSEELGIGAPPVTKWGAISFLWRQHAMKIMLVEALDHLQATSYQPQAIVMLSLSEKLLMTEEATKRDIKVIWLEHDPIGRWLSSNPWLPKLRSLSTLATTVVVSELSKKIYRGLGWNEKDITVIPNGVDLSRLVDRNEWRNPHSQHVVRHPPMHIGCIARLAKEKGIDVLLEALSDSPRIALTIVGEGPEEPFLQNFISDITVREQLSAPRIRLVKHIEDLEAFYSSLDAFVLPSRSHDPFGMVAAEAMMMGIPTIVTDACGIADYLKDGHDALLAKADSSESLRHALLQLMDENLRKKLSDHGKHTAEQKFSVEKMVEQYEKLLAT